MSRSRRKVPILPRAATSAKRDKQIGNRVFRRKTRYSMRNYIEGDFLGSLQSDHPDDIMMGDQNYRFQELPWKVKEVYNSWDFDKDGKFYYKVDGWERK